MPRVVIEPAGPGDAAELARLVAESTFDDEHPFAMRRDEDIFRIMDVRGDRWTLWVGRDVEPRPARLAWTAMLASRPVYVNGAERRVTQAPNIYISPAYRGGMQMARMFGFLRDHLLRGEDYFQVNVLHGNTRAMEAFLSGRSRMPRFYPVGNYAYISIPLGAGTGARTAWKGNGPADLEYRRARAEDADMVQDFFDTWAPGKQFYPCYDFRDLDRRHPYFRGLSWGDFLLAFRHGRLVGALAAWDQREFKTSVLLERSGDTVSPWLRPASPSRRFKHTLYLHGLLCRDNDPAVFAGLLAFLQREYADAEFEICALGLDAEDPLRKALEDQPHDIAFALHMLMTYGGDPRPALRKGPFYLETARC